MITKLETMYAETTEANRIEAKRCFLASTAGTGNINRLYGPREANYRANVLSKLTGKSISKSAASWHAFRNAMIDLYNVTGNSVADLDNNLQIKATSQQ